MGTPTIGGDVTGAVTDDTGDIVTGDLDDVGVLTGNTDDTYTITIAATYGTATINPTTGAWSYDLNDDHPAVNALDDGETMTDVFRVRMDDATQGSDTQDITITITGVVCFTTGTMIETARGLRPVETITEGDLVKTLDRGLQPVRWVSGRSYSDTELEAAPKQRPIVIRAGVLGGGLPARDLAVSPQHRVLVASRLALRIFGHPQILVPAVKLLGLPGIERLPARGGVGYHHFLFDAHEIVLAEGAPAESFYCGSEALKSLTGADRRRLAHLVPDLAAGEAPAPARHFPQAGGKLKALVRRSAANGIALLEPGLVPGVLPETALLAAE